MRLKGIIIFISFFILFSTSTITHAQNLTAAERAQLEAQLADVQAQQAQAQKDLVSAEAKSSSLKNDIALLAAKIKADQLDIQARNLKIKTLGDTITNKQTQIEYLDGKITAGKISIASMFRALYQIDAVSPFEIFLSGKTLSDFLRDADNIQTLQANLNALALELEATVASTTAEKDSLVIKKDAAIDARYEVQQRQAKVKANQTKQNQLLAISKGNEKAYGTLVAQKRAEAVAINAKLFALAGGSNPIQFGQAYQYALVASRKTGIDPAFLLAVLTQESNLGTNQGTCYLTNPSTGAGTSIKSGRSFSNVMSPTRDVPPFLSITRTLNVDPYRTVVSCPQSIGWGGAMGPAQFIASTWMLFVNRIQKAVGTTDYANPWNPAHAFMASALYLTDLGGVAGSYTGQMNAACRYYSGSSCTKSALVRSYGTSVMALTNKIQTTQIDRL